MWQEFERMDSNEALCAAIVDRVQPLTLNICTEGMMWHKHKVTVDKVLKRNKIVFDSAPEIISKYVRKIIAEASENQYFYCDEKKDDGTVDDNCLEQNIFIKLS